MHGKLLVLAKVLYGQVSMSLQTSVGQAGAE